MKCVVAWLDTQTGVYSFVWRRGQTTAQEQAAAAQLFSVGGDLPAQIRTDSRFKPHPSFSQAMKGTSVPAILVTLEGVSRSLIDGGLLGWLLTQHEATDSMEIGPFAAAARALGAGPDRRILQMAIQYLANGGVEDSLTAAEYDWNFLQEIRRDLLKQKG